jgi:co-chaperonin GroES (HSP10)
MNAEKITIPYNYVLVKALRKQDEILLKNGKKLYLDPAYEPEKHAITYAEIIKTPEQLFFSREEDIKKSTSFDVDIDIKIGDIVFFHYLSIGTALNDGKYIYENGEHYYLIRYDTIFLTIRGGETICQNGYVIVEGNDDERFENSKLDLSHLKKNSETSGTIVHLGNPVKEYYYYEDREDDTSLKVGDEVMFHEADACKMEYDLHKVLGGDRAWYRMQRIDISCVVNK